MYNNPITLFLSTNVGQYATITAGATAWAEEGKAVFDSLVITSSEPGVYILTMVAYAPDIDNCFSAQSGYFGLYS